MESLVNRPIQLLAVPPRKSSGTAPARSFIPVGSVSLLRRFEPARESMAAFLLRSSPERFPFESSGDGLCVLRISPARRGIGLPAGSLILLDSLHRCEPGGFSLLALCDGRILIRKFLPRNDSICFRSVLNSGGSDFIWHPSTEPDRLLWLYPILEFILPMF